MEYILHFAKISGPHDGDGLKDRCRKPGGILMGLLSPVAFKSESKSEIVESINRSNWLKMQSPKPVLMHGAVASASFQKQAFSSLADRQIDSRLPLRSCLLMIVGYIENSEKRFENTKNLGLDSLISCFEFRAREQHLTGPGHGVATDAR